MNTEIQKLAGKVGQSVFGMHPDEARKTGVCISCKKKVFYAPGQKAEKPGHIYSVPGQTEYRITALCEYCYDKICNEFPAHDYDPDANLANILKEM